MDYINGTKVYDPRLDTAPGANPADERFQVLTQNPALIFGHLARERFDAHSWQIVAEQANYCDAPVEMNEEIARSILGSMLVGDEFRDGFFGDPHEQDIDEDFVPKVRLDGRFTANHLEAIAWWMRNKAKG